MFKILLILLSSILLIIGVVLMPLASSRAAWEAAPQGQDFKGDAYKYKISTVIIPPASIFLYGMLTWDWGKHRFGARDEGWFQKGTAEGGMDKFGHAFSHKTMTEAYYHWFRYLGYEERVAGGWAALSTGLIGTFIELGDAFSHYGCSYSDFIADMLGVLLGSLYNMYPQLHNIVDYKLQYDFFKKWDMMNDYDHMKFAASFHLAAIPYVRELPVASMFNLDLGYYARHFHDPNPNDRERNFFLGFSINLSRLIDGVGSADNGSGKNQFRSAQKISSAFHFLTPSWTAEELGHLERYEIKRGVGI